MTPLIKKAFSVIIVCFGFALALNVWLFHPQPTNAQFILPFEGTPSQIEYNCLCSGSILVKVQPTTNSGSSQQIDLLYVWAADLLSNYIDIGLPQPHAYLWCGVAWTGEHVLLGNYIPAPIPCYQFVGPPDWCRFKSNATGVMLNVGSSLF